MAEWAKICCAVDFSDCSRLAMVEAAELARRFGAELTLLHVHEPTRAALEPAGARAAPALQTVDLERDLTVWGTEAERRTLTAVRTALRSGSPAVEILRHAREHDVDLLVLADRGRTRLEELVLGSVAERVVRQAPCPVLIVRHKEPCLERVETSGLERQANA